MVLSNSQLIRIWIAEDEDEFREILVNALTRENREVQSFQNGRDVLKALERATFDVLLTDLMMPEMDGIQLLYHVKQRLPDSIVIIMTGYASLDSALQAIRGGAYDYIRKPFKLDELEILLQNVCEKIMLLRENKDLLRELKETKQELARLRATWDEHLNQIFHICWILLREKKHPETELFLKSLQPLDLGFESNKKEEEGTVLKTLQQLLDLKKEKSISEEEFSTFKKILLKKLAEQ